MKRFIALSALGSLLAAPLAYGGPPRWAPPGHRGPPPPAYGYYHPPYSYHRHRGGGDSDEVAWAIGGLVLGAIIGTAAARAEGREAGPSGTELSWTPLPPPQKRKVVTCYDEVAYDESGNPYVARQCYENWR